MKTMLVLAALIAAPVLTPVAHAKAPRTHAIVLATADLDVRKPEDAATLVNRIEAALKPFCVENSSYDTVSSCVRDVTHKTVRQLGIPELKLALEHRQAPAIALAQR